MAARYALYYAPAARSELWMRGCRWLGRDPERDEALEQPSVPGFDPVRIAALTDSARRYGVHATLKPPFRLRAGCGEADLERAIAALARTQRRFMLPPLQVERLDGFLALVPHGEHADLLRLARCCVTQLDALRQPPDGAELARRRAAGLSARQEELLSCWGYPHVLEEFRFHLTLTERLDAQDDAHLRPWLCAWFAPARSATLAVEDLALYVEDTPGKPFRLVRRYRLDG